ncbi:hypothetical protein C8Q70DRAFT_899100, partial [Cubamyces menziesii]
EETAIGFQLRCETCKGKYGKGVVGKEEGAYCFVTTSHVFWERKEHWELPVGIPRFLKRCAVTEQLFNLIVELRPSSTAAGLAESIKREFWKLMPGRKTITISLDATFRAASKATVVSDDKSRTKFYKGGIETVLNEQNLIIAWVSVLPRLSVRRFCNTQANSELEEILIGLKRRFALLGVANPEMAVVDNCCHVKNAIKHVFPDIAVCLDVWHFMMRYLICITNGTRNPLRSAVARDVVDAILKTPAN